MKIRKLIAWGVLASSVYIGAALQGYAFRHPSLTDTERLLALIHRPAEVLLWR